MNDVLPEGWDADLSTDAQPGPPPEEQYIYATDDYPRDGCKATIHVRPHGYSLEITGPNNRPMEGYATVKSPAAISRMLREWCEGKRPAIKGGGD